MALTPQTHRRPNGRLFALVVLVALFGAACSATPNWVPVEGEAAAPVGAETATDAEASTDEFTSSNAGGQAPEELAFVDDSPDADTAMASEDFCAASANIWIHSAALNLIGNGTNTEMNQIALANVSEWLERSTLFDEDGVDARVDMFTAFTELRATVGNDFDSNWTTYQSSTAYANDPVAQDYDTARAEIVTFINDRCELLSMSDLRADAKARAAELADEFGTDPSTLTESDSLPGHAIFTHSSGRLIASFPAAWAHEEGRSDAIVDLIAAPDIDQFLGNEAVDGIRLQLLNAATIEDFRTLIAETTIGSSCQITNDLSDTGTVRTNITQTFACDDHGATIIGQYNVDRGLGLIIEASFNRPDASRADLIRLSSIANSALWS